MQSPREGAQRPLPSTYCPFCVDRHKLRVVQERDTVDAFSLHNLIPAGTIPVAVHDGGLPCPSAFNNRDWHLLSIRSLSTHPVDTPFQELAFLTKHLFLRATCRLSPSGRVIFIRVYLIPNDLPNVHGQLHRRPVAVVKEAQRHLQCIIPLIEQNGGLWDADEGSLNAPQRRFLPNHADNRTMAEIYSDLPSPGLGPAMNGNARLSHGIASGDAIWGLRTTLYGYQRHSVAVMLYRESSTDPVPDPLYISVSSMSGTHFYIRPSTMTVLQERPMFSPPRAGMLCEELGTGKTVMIIALVLITASQLADPEGSVVDGRPVLTPLAYRHFPSRECAIARERAGLGQIAIQQLPSLTELLIHHFSSAKVTMGCPAFASELAATHLWPFIQANKAFYHHNPELTVDSSKRSSRRTAANLGPRTVYLSSATLVVVPLTLLGQWKTEIDKHCHDCVRYLVVRTSMDLPNARKLASDYELVIMSNTRFREESKKNKLERLCDLKPCTCPCLAGSRVPDCRCCGDPDVTPLLQVRWKRLVIDEGHNTGSVAATINYFVQQLSVQHKWIVTGTPTSNILGLRLGRKADEEEMDLLYPDFDSPDVMSLCPDEGPHVRIWGSYDRFNLRRLGTMITNFLTVPQFRDDLESFRLHVVAPLCNRRGPRPGAISVLNQVMQMIMVRHRIEDVENDVLLPPMRHDIIYMNLDRYALMSYNAMQASVAINAIDSEREGADYLFHPSKVKELQTTINNASQGLFWSASDTLYNVDQICDLASEYVARAVKRRVCPEELYLLQKALEHASAAAKDKMWRAMQPYPDIPFEVSGLDSGVFAAWTRTGLCDANQTIHIMHPDRLINLRSLVRTKPLILRDELVEEGNIHDGDEQWRAASKLVSSRETRHGADQTKKMAKEVQRTIEVLRERVGRVNASEDDELKDCQDRVTQVASTGVAAVHVTTRFSPLSGVKVGPSLSTKLNYVLSEVQQYSMTEKFLIFSDSLLTLFQIGEALSLFEIKCLRYTNEEGCLLREQCITTFETSDVYRVLLMELKLGARGLNLISASRIIFCEPVWHPDVESQAIKRAHRIGQTRPVTVKTLVIRSTAEEAMIARKRYLRSSDKVPNMTTESGMRQYLQNPRFLTESAPDLSVNVVLALDDKRQAASADTQSSASQSPSGDSTIVDVVDSGVSTYEPGGMTARKRVRFEFEE